jgi:leucyl/phenylalanyl-tRNA--protein transferase
MIALTPDLVLKAYACGVFPMAEGKDDPGVFWIDPDWRGILPLDDFRIPRRLARTVRSDRFEISVDQAFDAVIRGCAKRTPRRRETWINDAIRQVYSTLHARGFAHSVECWRGGQIVGGLYGVALGAAFFGESMFSVERDASKVALVHLVERLRVGGYTLLDTQFVTRHLINFGAIEVRRAEYLELLNQALGRDATFYPDSLGRVCGSGTILQSRTQMS